MLAGDRQVAVRILEFLINHGDAPAVLCVSRRPSASHSTELEHLFRSNGGAVVLDGADLVQPTAEVRSLLESLDFSLSVHFPEIVKAPALHLPHRGWLNLHPSYLPYNRGWHTPSWAILDQSPAGVSLHRMVDEVDAGAVLLQREIPVEPWDTANSLYQRLLDAEYALVEESWDDLRSLDVWPEVDLPADTGSLHTKADLLSPGVRQLDLDAQRPVRDVINQLRALTTDRWSEAAYFDDAGKRVHLRLELSEEDPQSDEG